MYSVRWRYRIAAVICAPIASSPHPRAVGHALRGTLVIASARSACARRVSAAAAQLREKKIIA